MILEGYELINGEYVKKADLLAASEIHNHIEKDVVNFFDNLGFRIKRMLRLQTEQQIMNMEN